MRVVARGISGEDSDVSNIIRGFIVITGAIAVLAAVVAGCWMIGCVVIGVASFAVRLIGTALVFLVPIGTFIGLCWLVGWLFKRVR